MPSLRSRAVDISDNYRRADPPGEGGQPPRPVASIPTPLPPHLTRHPMMISALPGIAGNDLANRQFYLARNLPSRRISTS